MRKLFLLLLALIMLVGISVGNVSAYSVGLSLVMDSSGSITPPNWDLQRTGYANSLQGFFAANNDLFGNVSLNIVQYGRDYTNSISWTAIDTQANLDAFTNQLLVLNQNSVDVSATATGNAIQYADSLFEPTMFDFNIIDVSTDGYSNWGINPVDAAMAAVDTGFTDAVNVLGIGIGDLNFQYGTNPDGSPAFSLSTPDFASFESAIYTKLEQEIATVPEPATLLLLGTGLLGMVVARRKIRK